jgi:hypothetical protein
MDHIAQELLKIAKELTALGDDKAQLVEKLALAFEDWDPRISWGGSRQAQKMKSYLEKAKDLGVDVRDFEKILGDIEDEAKQVSRAEDQLLYQYNKGRDALDKLWQEYDLP